jgi:hypothetical protein
MSIFTSTLAYNAGALQVISKVAVISASVVAAILGHTWFRRVMPAATTTMHVYKEITENREQEEVSLALS